jgi:TRAP-type C4-dicarboxylate transport system permease small subunit
MAQENPMPKMPVHVLGLAFTAALIWACYIIWQVMPQFTGPTIFSEFRIVGAMLAMFVLLSLAQIIVKLAKLLLGERG